MINLNEVDQEAQSSGESIGTPPELQKRSDGRLIDTYKEANSFKIEGTQPVRTVLSLAERT